MQNDAFSNLHTFNHHSSSQGISHVSTVVIATGNRKLRRHRTGCRHLQRETSLCAALMAELYPVVTALGGNHQALNSKDVEEIQEKIDDIRPRK